MDLHHVSLNVSNMEEAEAFYVNILGLKVLPRPDFDFDGRWLSMGERQIHLIDAEVPTQVGQHVAFRVADVDAAVAEVRAKGIEATDPFPVGTGRQAFIYDPSGNKVELNQPG